MSKTVPINYVELPAADLAATESFYGRTFGWTFTSYGPEYVAFSDGQFNGGFYRADCHSSTDNGAALIVLYAADLESCEQSIIKAGGRIIKAIFSFPGGRRFHFADPSGNELAVWSETK